MPSLTDSSVRSAKPREKPYKLFDAPRGRGLYLIVNPAGGKWWRLRYRHEGRECLISLGTYPDVGLKDARLRRDEARRGLANGIDPSAARKAKKASRGIDGCLEAVAREWHTKQAASWTPAHKKKIITTLERDVFPWLGKSPVGDITAPQILVVLRRIESRGAAIIARRCLSDLSRIFKYAFATGRALYDPAAPLRGTLSAHKETHHAALTDPRTIGGLLRALDGYEGNFVTQCALRLSPLLMLRPGELRKMEWSEIDFDQAELRIPAKKMKMRVMHIVPLSQQAVSILRELHPLTGHGRYVFPGAYTLGRPLSCNTANSALRRLGFDKTEMTSHGWRTVASTLLAENGWPSEIVERQLAHKDTNKVRAAYNHAQFLQERRRLMQWWSDYLDGLRGIGVETD